MTIRTLFQNVVFGLLRLTVPSNIRMFIICVKIKIFPHRKNLVEINNFPYIYFRYYCMLLYYSNKTNSILSYKLFIITK